LENFQKIFCELRKFIANFEARNRIAKQYNFYINLLKNIQ